MTPAELTRHFHAKIPMSAQMGVQVLEADSQHALLSVPLAPNINHVMTAFGGSLYSTAALSCYALFQMISLEAGGLSDTLVIQDGSIRYLAPVPSDYKVRSRLSDPKDAERFVESLKRHGKGRLKLQADVVFMKDGQEKIGAQFEGLYVFRA